MTLDELELDHRSKFFSDDDPESGEDFTPVWVGGKWLCKGCETYVDCAPEDGLCEWCADKTIKIERIRNQAMEHDGEVLPRHIFKRMNSAGQVIYSTFTEDGRIVDLDD